METKLKNPKPRIEVGSAAATRPSTPLFPERGTVLRVEPGDSLFMRERGELQRGVSPQTQLHKRAIVQGFRRCETVLQERFDWR